MQHTSYFHNNLYISMDTSSSTRQQFFLSSSSPFQMTSPRHRRNQDRITQSKNVWSNKQKLQYSIFLCYFRDFFLHSQLEKVEWKVFRGMSRFISTRNPQQCRSHHIKLIKKFKNVKMFLKLFVRRITGLKEKITQVERQLESIQQQFELYIEMKPSQQSERKDRQNYSQLTKVCLKDCKMNSLNFVGKQKEDFIKTADDYSLSQTPVQVQNCSINNCQASNCFSDHVNTSRQTRLSLPSFDDEKNEKREMKESVQKWKKVDFKGFPICKCQNKLLLQSYDSNFLQFSTNVRPEVKGKEDEKNLNGKSENELKCDRMMVKG